MSLSFKTFFPILLGSLFGLAGCAGPTQRPQLEKPLLWVPASFDIIRGQEAAFEKGERQLDILRLLCQKAERKGADAFFGTGPKAAQTGTVRAWQAVCTAAQNPATIWNASFIERYFSLYKPRDFEPSEGLFTGYYEPSLEADSTCHGAFQTPIWQRPQDMLQANLKDFDPSLAGKKITGKVQGQHFVPYDDRADIAAGSLEGRAEKLACARDPVDAFFLEIQGSGRLVFPDGSEMRIGYEAQNGHAYVPIGRVMLAEGLLDRPVTMQKIRTFLAAHLKERQDLLNKNPSQVFFKIRKGKEPIGALGLPLTPGYSLAVDKNKIPLGIPLWLEVNEPASSRFVFTMDTGGAIRGPIRGDLFWGHGREAENKAGTMQSEGLYYLLLPKGVTP